FEVGIVIGSQSTPFQKIGFEIARLKDGSNRGLEQTIVAELWFGITPAFQEMVLRDHKFAKLSGFVKPFAKGDTRFYIFQRRLELICERMRVSRICAAD